MNKLQTNRSYSYLLLADRIFMVLLFLFLFFGLLRIRTGIPVVVLFFLYQAVMLAVFRIRFLEPLRETEEISEITAQSERHMADLEGGRSIHRLIQYVKQSVENEYTSQMLVSQTEIHTPQNQTNPHFLYNILDTVHSMAIIQDSEDIAQMTESLSMLFQYSISRPGETAIPKDELDNVKNYLVIQRYRFPGKFKYQQRIEDEEFLQYKLPVLIIQPVIENVIHYGLETKVGGGQVGVYAYSTQEHFIIHIADNGVGMTEQQTDSLRERLSKGGLIYEQDRDLKRRGNAGIAPPSMNQRIKFCYGDDYGIKVYNTAGIGTIAEIISPTATDLEGDES